jgi:hypothetical protein
MRELVIRGRLVVGLFRSDVVEHELLQLLRPIAVVLLRYLVELRDEFLVRPDIYHLFHPRSIRVKRMYSKKILVYRP